MEMRSVNERVLMEQEIKNLKKYKSCEDDRIPNKCVRHMWILRGLRDVTWNFVNNRVVKRSRKSREPGRVGRQVRVSLVRLC